MDRQDEEIISCIKRLIDPSSENYLEERSPYLRSEWATLQQLKAAVKSLNFQVSNDKIEDLCLRCSRHHLYGYSIDQFAEEFNKYMKK